MLHATSILLKTGERRPRAKACHAGWGSSPLRSRAPSTSTIGPQEGSPCRQHPELERQAEGRPREAPAAPAPTPASTDTLLPRPRPPRLASPPGPKRPAGGLLCRLSPSRRPQPLRRPSRYRRCARACAMRAPGQPQLGARDEAQYSPLMDGHAAFGRAPLPQPGGLRAYPHPGS